MDVKTLINVNWISAFYTATDLILRNFQYTHDYIIYSMSGIENSPPSFIPEGHLAVTVFVRV